MNAQHSTTLDSTMQRASQPVDRHRHFMSPVPVHSGARDPSRNQAERRWRGEVDCASPAATRHVPVSVYVWTRGPGTVPRRAHVSCTPILCDVSAQQSASTPRGERETGKAWRATGNLTAARARARARIGRPRQWPGAAGSRMHPARRSRARGGGGAGAWWCDKLTTRVTARGVKDSGGWRRGNRLGTMACVRRPRCCVAGNPKRRKVRAGGGAGLRRGRPGLDPARSSPSAHSAHARTHALLPALGDDAVMTVNHGREGNEKGGSMVGSLFRALAKLSNRARAQ